MIADTIGLVDGFIGTDRRQFIIPIYQRRYKWTNEQCSRLIDDMLKSAEKQVKHFTGAVVYKNMPSGSFQRAFLVDGQQRLTTILLILKALSIICKPHLNDDRDYAYVYENADEFLYADKKDHSKGFKIIPSKNDSEIFNLIMSSESIETLSNDPIILQNKNNLLFNNYRDIYKRLENEIALSKNIRDDIFEGLLALTVVEMSLEQNDDPQEIFESINSLGVKLNNSDLIRNYLLMTNDDQKQLFEQYWEPIQDIYIGENHMDDFVSDYLLLKKKYAINYADIYKEYVSFAREKNGTSQQGKEELLKDLLKVAKIYQPFIKECSHYSSVTNMLMQELRDMGQTTAYPFLMKVFLDYSEKKISENTLNQVINLVIVYLVRRTICGIPTHSLRGFMLNLYSRIFKIQDNYKRYYESVYAFLTTLQSNDAMPSIESLRTKLKEAQLYNNVKFCTYLLYKIENGRYPNPYSEFTLANSASVEHIMPQTLTDEWGEMLGVNSEYIHSTYLNTLGNLSLSSRPKNSMMSNESFVIKKEILTKDGSKFNVLNKDVVNYNCFTEKQINEREERLSEIIISKYDLGNVNTKGIRFEETTEVICADEVNNIFNGAQPISFELFGEEHPVSSFAGILVSLTKLLLEKYPERIRDLAANKYYPWDSPDSYALYYAPKANDRDAIIEENICLHTNFNAAYIIQFCARLLQECGLSADIMTINLKKDSIKKENAFDKNSRLSIIRETLTRLSNEGIIIYSPETMPKSSGWIKFQTNTLNQVFDYDGKPTSWDREKFQCIAYYEYHLATHTLLITAKTIKDSQKWIDRVYNLKEKFNLEEKEETTTYWHIKQYQFDFPKIVNSDDRETEFYNQIVFNLNEAESLLKSILEEINSI